MFLTPPISARKGDDLNRSVMDGMIVKDPITNTEPCVQQLVIGPYRETGVGPQGLAGAGLSGTCAGFTH